MKIKKVVSYICVIMVMVSAFSTASAEMAPYELPDFMTGNPDSIDRLPNDEAEVRSLEMTVEEAVAYGLVNNPNIGKLDNAIDLAVVAVGYAEGNIEELEDAQEKLDEAENDLFDLGVALNQNQKDLNAAYSLLEKGRSPVKLTYNDIYKYVDENMRNMLAYLGISGDDAIFVVGADIEATLEGMLVGVGYSEAEAGFAAAAYYDDVYSIIKAQLDYKQDTLDQYNLAMDEAQETFDYNQDKFESVLNDVADKLDAKINYTSVVQLETDDAVDLMITMADVNLDVTRYAKGIYRNQIAMLVQKNYYDALYAAKMVDLKKLAMERGKTQYDLVNLSYENGMKAKDDMLLAKMYYDGTKVDYRLAQATYNNSIFELKKNMNYDMSKNIILVEPLIQESIEESLDQALKSGMTNRIEMQMALGQWMIYGLNEDILTRSREYKGEEASIDEAILLREGAELELERIKKMVESEIYQSYENLQATQYILEVSSNLVGDASEVLAIAKLKYEQGLGAENSLLQKMNLETSTGTIVELIAAQENLADMEANVAQIRYNNTMAKIKYLNDAGILVY